MSTTRQKIQYFIRPESGQEDVIGPVIGPYNGLQLTYSELRDENGEMIAFKEDDDFWKVVDTGKASRHGVHNCPQELAKAQFSDVVIWAEVE